MHLAGAGHGHITRLDELGGARRIVDVVPGPGQVSVPAGCTCGVMRWPGLTVQAITTECPVCITTERTGSPSAGCRKSAQG